MKKLLIALMLVAGVTTNVQASNLVRFSQSSTDTYYYDSSNFSQGYYSNGFVNIIWVSSINQQTGTKWVDRTEVHCQSRMFRLTQSQQYYRNGSPIDGQSFTNGSARFQYAMPDTMGYELINSICGK